MKLLDKFQNALINVSNIVKNISKLQNTASKLKGSRRHVLQQLGGFSLGGIEEIFKSSYNIPLVKASDPAY